MPNYNEYIRGALAKMTVEDVNRAIRKHLRADNIQIVGVSKDAVKLAQLLTSDAPSPITYNSPKPKELLDEDKTIERWPLHLRAEDVKVLPADTFVCRRTPASEPDSYRPTLSRCTWRFPVESTPNAGVKRPPHTTS